MSHSNRQELQALTKIVRATQGADFGSALQTSLSRRRFFLAGGATISFGALLAACGAGESTGIARLGDSVPDNALADVEVTDVVGHEAGARAEDGDVRAALFHLGELVGFNGLAQLVVSDF